MNMLPKYRVALRPVLWLLMGLAVVLAVSWAAPPIHSIKGVAGYVPLHTLLETIAIVVSMMVFGVCWGAYDKARPGNLILLASIFLGVAMLDFLHTLSYKGMPDFVTPGGPEKSINFWLVARYLSALGLLAVAVLPWRPLRFKALRWLGLAMTLALVALAAWIGLLHQDWVPRTFITGEGLTSFKRTSEYFLIALFLVTALIFLLRMRKEQPYDVVGLFAAVNVMALSELYFTLYSDVTDIFSVLGHVYKVIAYGFIYKSIFVDIIKRPFQGLQQANAALSHEVGQRREAEAERDRISSVVEASPDFISMASPDGRLLYLNRGGRAMTGVGERPANELRIADMHPQWATDVVIEQGLPTALRDGHWAGETTVLNREGGEIPVSQVILAHRDSQGELRYFSTAMRDITERKLAENVLNAVNDAQSQFIAKRTPAEIFNGLLNAILKITGSEYGFIGEVLRAEDGKPYIKAHGITNIAWNEETRRFFEESAPTGLNFFTLDNLFGKVVTQRQVIIANDPANDPRSAGLPKGHPILNRFMGVPFFEGGEVIGMIALANRPDGYAEDLLPLMQPLLTASKNILGSLRLEQQRVAAEAALQQLNEELEQRVEQRTAEMKSAMIESERANAAKSEFLSRMSHELRTPLNAILGFGQLLETDPEHPLTVDQVDNVHEILHGGEHLLELVNEVLDLARIESGRLEVSLDAVAVKPLVEACVAQINPLAAQRGISVSLALDASCMVLADRTRLKQVLLNLLSNAVKYNREGGSIQIRCAENGERLRISVQDSGPGIPAESLIRLFRPFERLETAYEGIEGTGIGLALSKKLVEAMGGEIGVESTPGEGSTFWFELPLAAGSEAVSGPVATPVSASAGRCKKLLCIEDNPANLRLVHKILATRPDIELLDATSAEAGLEMAATGKPDIILLDINLPGMDGFEALRQLRDNPLTRDIPVIALTANAMTRDIERGKAAGFSHYLIKPLDVRQFHETLDACLAQLGHSRVESWGSQ